MTPDQVLTSGLQWGCGREGLSAGPKALVPSLDRTSVPSSGCLQGVLLAFGRQHQLFFGVSPRPGNNIPAGPLIALPGHGLYYACLMNN